jgi:hypothetical protein
MQRTELRVILAVTIAIGAILFAVSLALTGPADEAESWKPAAEGFLAVATPCCTEASLWNALDTVNADGQRPRAATVAEAAQWLNEWPYRSRDEEGTSAKEELGTAMQGSQVRCVGAPTGPELAPRDGDDEWTLKAVRYRRECSYVKWKVWSGDTAQEHLHERHAVWFDEDGFYHGRVDYWR